MIVLGNNFQKSSGVVQPLSNGLRIVRLVPPYYEVDDYPQTPLSALASHSFMHLDCMDHFEPSIRNCKDLNPTPITDLSNPTTHKFIILEQSYRPSPHFFHAGN
jgi:hypothetical protein